MTINSRTIAGTILVGATSLFFSTRAISQAAAIAKFCDEAGICTRFPIDAIFASVHGPTGMGINFPLQSSMNDRLSGRTVTQMHKALRKEDS